MRDDIKALELAHERASEEYRKAVENCTKMMQDAMTLGDGNEDGAFIRSLARALLGRATRKRTEAASRLSQAVLKI